MSARLGTIVSLCMELMMAASRRSPVAVDRVRVKLMVAALRRSCEAFVCVCGKCMSMMAASLLPNKDFFGIRVEGEIISLYMSGS